MKNIFVQEAIRIGDQLIDTADRNENGLFWLTAKFKTDSEVTWKQSENIYSGVSGIVLFLIALYKQTLDKKYLSVSEDAMKWVDWYCKQNSTDNYALFTGRMGVSFTFLKLYEATNNKSYLEKALAVAQPSLAFLESSSSMNDYLNGFSGALLGLLHLHAATKESWILDHIKQYTQKLLKNARFGNVGLYWDTSLNEIHPLCGFPHGPSGIGFVFLELGHYFQDSAYYHIAEQAFAYENDYFNPETNNWPDFRLFFYNQEAINEYKQAYLKKNLQVFTHPSYVNQWCQGAAGIGLSRLHAFELLKKETYRKDIKNALTKPYEAYYPPFTLCHGKGGSADFLLESYLMFHKKKYLEYAQKTAEDALEQKK
ncbi:MAG: lanthionine synthetase LanC family protein, partial [Candidatus Levyibacteriota bacterium]